MMPKLPKSALLMHSDDGKSMVQIYSPDAVRAIQEEAYRAGMAAELERCAKVLDALGCDHCSAALRFSRKQPEVK